MKCNEVNSLSSQNVKVLVKGQLKIYYVKYVKLIHNKQSLYRFHLKVV